MLGMIYFHSFTWIWQLKGYLLRPTRTRHEMVDMLDMPWTGLHAPETL